MSNYKKINNITGWLIFLIATFVYVVTLEPTASFWDCGEFIACSFKLQVPHPPGAPLFLLIGRIFSLFAGSDLTKVAFWVNMVSALSSSFTILFLFWTITLLAKKLTQFDAQPSTGKVISIMGSGIIGSLAFTFSDSFWFSAEEAEVYAMSAFFTAFVFWAILKWEEQFEDEDSDKWLILIAYTLGLSIGVHLLNLLAVPALGYVYYFKKNGTITTKGLVLTLLSSLAIMLSILEGIIPGFPSQAGNFEVYFVNDLGLGFNSGIILFILLFIVFLVGGILFTINRKKNFLYISAGAAIIIFIPFGSAGLIFVKLLIAGGVGLIYHFYWKDNLRILNIILLSFAFIIIGYSSYGLILIRSNFNPPIDENDPENIISFVSYLKREQYGDRPLFSGPYFTAGYPIDAEQGAPMYRKDDKLGQYIVFDHKMNYIYDPKHMTLFPRAYSTQPNHVEAYREKMHLKEGKKPTKLQDWEYMFSYQIKHMYIRYFMWNFAGRESDIQDAWWIYPWNTVKGLPDVLAHNKARNNFYMLPLILGFAGMVYHFNRNKKDASIVALLFFFTGIAIILYLNQPPVEPRERDYTYTGSFYAFAIWIGIGVLFIGEMLEYIIKNNILRPVVATAISLAIPGIMAAKGWDDHDRSDRYHSVDSAKNLLNSCAKNAVLFTGGDNDTFPLWYVQEVEGFRTDVRVCNLSLLNTDWYIAQMKRKAYNSDPLPISLDYEDFIQGKNDQVYYFENPRLKNGINLTQYIELVRNDDPLVKEDRGGQVLTILPSKNIFLNVNKEQVIQSGIVPDKYKEFVVDRMSWNINTTALEKQALIILDLIATNNWKRPIYFSTTLSGSNFLNLKEYTQLEGLAYRLLPVKIPGAPQGWMDTDIMFDNMMHHYFWRGLDNTKVYYDENFLRFPINARSQFYRLASQLMAEGKKEKAKEAIDFCLKVMPDASIPYDFTIPPYIPLLFKVGEEKRAMDIATILGKRSEEDLIYYTKNKIAYNRDYELCFYMLDQISRALKEAGKTKEASKYENLLIEYSSKIGAQ
jgi:hypothetical protein